MSLQGLLVEERDRLTQQVAGLEGLQQSLDGEVAALRGQLGAEQSRSQALEGSQREVRGGQTGCEVHGSFVSECCCLPPPH